MEPILEQLQADHAADGAAEERDPEWDGPHRVAEADQAEGQGDEEDQSGPAG